MTLPLLYSFRRCPYAMRARMALSISAQTCRLREVALRDKPVGLLAASPKATVPVLLLPDGEVLEESLAIMHWALAEADPEGWLLADPGQRAASNNLISDFDVNFKYHLDRYKYASRYDDAKPEAHRAAAMNILDDLNDRLAARGYLFGDRRSLADIALMPFVRQFAHTDRSWFEAQDLPHLQAWLAALLDSDLFTGIMQKYPVWRTGDAEALVFGP